MAKVTYLTLERDLFELIEKNQQNLTRWEIMRYFCFAYCIGVRTISLALEKLVKLGLVRCVLHRGSARWSVANKDGVDAEIIPTEYARRLRRSGEIMKLFWKNNLY